MPRSVDATLLRHFFERPHDFQSASELAAPYSMTDLQVRERLHELEKAGYTIEFQSPLGFRLGPVPDLLCADEIQGRLHDSSPWRVIVLRETRSTMDVVLREARVGAPEGLVVLAERQAAGRGRQGRRWESPPESGLYLSILLRPSWPIEQFSQLTLMISLAAAEAIENVTSLPARIKWPNDLMLQGKKIGGILTEVQMDSQSKSFAVIGIGLNLNQLSAHFSPELQSKATSLRIESGQEWRRVEILLALLNSIQQCSALPFDQIREKWTHRCTTLGQYVTLQTSHGTRQGHALGIQEDGTLLLRTEGGTTEVITSGLIE